MMVAEADPRALAFRPRDGRDTDVLESTFLISSRSGESFHYRGRLDLAYPPEVRAQLEKSLAPGAARVRAAARRLPGAVRAQGHEREGRWAR